MKSRRSGTAILSRTIGFSLPILLATYWPFFGIGESVHAVVVLIRLTLIVAVLALGVFWSGVGTSRSEVMWSGVFASYLCISLTTCMIDPEATRGLHNWVRILGLYAVAIVLSRPLRHKATERAFAVALAIAGIASLLFILGIYHYYAGLSIPTYERIREFKSGVQHASGIALNPLASATLLFGVMSLCLLRAGWAQISAMAVVAVLSSAFTGSRAPLALAFLGGVAVALTNLLHNRTLAVRAVACLTIAFVIFGGCFGISLVDPRLLSVATAGRYDVWTVGMQKFLERPITGNGAESWRDDLASRLPGYYEGTSGLARLRAGGYHSEFVTLLSEGGLLCFIPAMVIFGLLFRSCCRIAYNPATPWLKGQATLLAFFLILFRAAVEVPGLFGYGEDVTDYLAAMFVAIVVSRASLLEKRETVPKAKTVTAAIARPLGKPAFGAAVLES